MKRICLILSILSAFLGNQSNLCNYYIKSNCLNSKQLNNSNKIEESLDSCNLDCNTKISLDIKNTPYTEEIISITGTVDKQYKIECDSNDIEIITSNIDNTSDLLLEFKLNTSKEEFEIELNFKNDNNDIVDSITLYINKTELGTFIRQVSNKVNVENYKSYQLEKDVISQVEYDVYNSKINSNFISLASNYNVVLPTRPSTLCGVFKWTDNQGNVHPLAYNYYEFIKKVDSTYKKVSSGYTTKDGKYSITLPSVSSDTSYFVRIYSKGKYTGVVKSLSSNNYYYYDTDITIVKSSMKYLGIVLDKSYTILNNGTSDDNYIGKAMEISQALNYGAKYVKEMNASTPDFENAEYPSGYVKSSTAKHINEFNNDTCGIYLGEYTYCYWDVILHEYGHHLENYYNLIDSSVSVKNHNSSNDDIKQFGKKVGVRIAWSESWPTVFGNLVTKYFADELTNIQYVNDDNYDGVDENNKRCGYSLENLENNIKFGEGCERDIMYFLFDMFDDTTNEDFDTIALGHKQLWDLVINSQAHTFSEFIQYVYNNSNVDQNELGKILGEYGMAVTQFSITSTSSSSVCPTLQWNNCNNAKSIKYSLKIFDQNNNLILEITISKTHVYTLSSNEWNKIWSSNSSKFYVIISAYQPNDFETGPYHSKLFSFTK